MKERSKKEINGNKKNERKKESKSPRQTVIERKKE